GRAVPPAAWRWPRGPGGAPSPCSPRVSGSGPGPTIPAPPETGSLPGERIYAVGSPHEPTRNNFSYYGYMASAFRTRPVPDPGRQLGFVDVVCRHAFHSV